MHVEEFLSLLKNVKKSGNGWTALCPAHDDNENSLSVGRNGDKILVNCFAGCTAEQVVAALGLTMKDLFYRQEIPHQKITVAALAADKALPEAFLRRLGVKDTKNAVKISYFMEDGTPAPRQRIRTALKAKDGSKWTRGEGKPVPYGLWRLAEARKAGFLVLVEGESDCWTLWHHGFPALGLPGADMTKTLRAAYFQDISHVYIFREPDRGGETFVRGVVEQFSGWRSWRGELREINLPGAKDPNELHRRNPGSFKEAFEAALEAAEPLELTPGTAEETEPQADRRPAINAGIQDLETVSKLAVKALCLANKDNPFLFLRGGPVRLEQDEAGNLITRELTPDRLRHELARAAKWYRVEGKDEEKPAKPPMDVVRDILATPRLPFPVLAAITRAPVFAPDGALRTDKGYHPESQTYYSPANGLVIPDVPEKPTADDVNRAKELIFTELLGDFPFADQADRAHAVALLLLPFVRAMIAGPTPLHLIEASTQGSGKGLLAEVLLYPAIGRSVGVIPPPRDDEELRKSITARLREGRPAILFDNVYSLTSAVLAAALTAEVWDDRLLGRSETVYIPVRCAWVATANNATVSTDIARRSIRIRLTPQQDRPWLREDFRHPNLKLWAAEHRGELIWAALTLVRAWLAAGRPRPAIKLLGSFESWTEVIGGILECAGIDGFLANVLEFYEAADTEGTVWRQFVAAWWEKFGPQPVKASDLFSLAVEIDGFDLGKGATERAQKTAFGMKLKRQKDRIFDIYRIEAAGTIDKVQGWRLNCLDPKKYEDEDMPF